MTTSGWDWRTSEIACGDVSGAADHAETVTDAEDSDHALAGALVGVDDEQREHQVGLGAR